MNLCRLPLPVPWAHLRCTTSLGSHGPFSFSYAYSCCHSVAVLQSNLAASWPEWEWVGSSLVTSVFLASCCICRSFLGATWRCGRQWKIATWTSARSVYNWRPTGHLWPRETTAGCLRSGACNFLMFFHCLVHCLVEWVSCLTALNKLSKVYYSDHSRVHESWFLFGMAIIFSDNCLRCLNASTARILVLYQFHPGRHSHKASNHLGDKHSWSPRHSLRLSPPLRRVPFLLEPQWISTQTPRCHCHRQIWEESRD